MLLFMVVACLGSALGYNPEGRCRCLSLPESIEGDTGGAHSHNILPQTFGKYRNTAKKKYRNFIESLHSGRIR